MASGTSVVTGMAEVATNSQATATFRYGEAGSTAADVTVANRATCLKVADALEVAGKVLGVTQAISDGWSAVDNFRNGDYTMRIKLT